MFIKKYKVPDGSHLIGQWISIPWPSDSLQVDQKSHGIFLTEAKTRKFQEAGVYNSSVISMWNTRVLVHASSKQDELEETAGREHWVLRLASDQVLYFIFFIVMQRLWPWEHHCIQTNLKDIELRDFHRPSSWEYFIKFLTWFKMMSQNRQIIQGHVISHKSSFACCCFLIHCLAMPHVVDSAYSPDLKYYLLRESIPEDHILRPLGCLHTHNMWASLSVMPSFSFFNYTYYKLSLFAC